MKNGFDISRRFHFSCASLWGGLFGFAFQTILKRFSSSLGLRPFPPSTVSSLLDMQMREPRDLIVSLPITPLTFSFCALKEGRPSVSRGSRPPLFSHTPDAQAKWTIGPVQND